MANTQGKFFIYTEGDRSFRKSHNEIMAMLSFHAGGAVDYFYQQIKWDGIPFRFTWAGVKCSISYDQNGGDHEA